MLTGSNRRKGKKMNKPSIVANFVLDSAGSPTVASQKRLTHYHMKIRMLDTPDDTYQVVYTLHRSFPNRTREGRDQSRDFQIKIATYGDFEVKASVRRRNGPSIELERRLSLSLNQGHALDDANLAVQAALTAIANN